jgi:L-ribulose-5-phosphate 4-epimerase
MSAKYLLGLDIGGGGSRCLLVNAETGETTSAFHPWTLPPAPEVGGFAYKMDLPAVWNMLGEASRTVLERAKVEPAQVCGVAGTSMRHSTVVLDKKGRVLMAAPNRDARAAAQGMQVAIERGEELYRLSGHYPSPIFLASRLLWLKETQPEEYKSAFAAICLSDWLGWRLSGELASEPAQSGESLLLELKTRKWSGDLIKSLGLSEKLLPPLKPAGARLGKLTREAAANLGLLPGIPVAVGGPDTQCGLLGVGVTSAGQLGVVAGTTAPVQMVTAAPVFDESMHTWSGLHVIPGLYVLESNAGQMGSTLEWIARLVHPAASNPVAVFAAEAVNSIPGANGMLSTVGAAVFNAAGMEPPVDNLTFSSVSTRLGEAGRADLARAVLEGMAYAVRANIEQIKAVAGVPPTDCRLTGGISRSAAWTGMVGDVLGTAVQVSATAEATALGAAICAGVGAGLFHDLAEGAAKLAKISRTHEPGPDASAYQELYSGWMELRQERRPADIVAINRFTDAMMSGLAEGPADGASVSFRPRIYISAEVDEAALKRLGGIGEVTYKPYRSEGILLTGDDLVQTLKGYHVFVTEVDILDAEALLQLPDLRMVVVCRGNPVNIDIEACSLASVPVTNTPARNADAVADLAVGFMLMLARKLAPASSFLRQPGGEAGDLGRMGQAHEEFLGVELWRKTAGIIGGGAIGRKVTARLLPFGTRILVYDPFLSAEQVAATGAEKVTLERLLAESDFVSLHAAVTDDTRAIINAAALEKMKPGAYLVNTARAALVQQEALLDALQAGKLGGYAADVFTVEPPGADDPLLAFPNVLATPHMGGNTLEVAAHQGEIIADDLELLLAGKRPKYLLNPTTLGTFTWTAPRRTDEKALLERKAAPGPGTTDLEVSAQKPPSEAGTKPASTPAAADQPAVMTGKVESMDTNSTRQKMADILKEFTTCIAADKEMAAFAKGKNVVFIFTIKDLDLSFFLSFVEGQVAAGLGAPAREADVKLKMSADILDGMFTGRVNATKAATSGKLSFSGDTGKAMSFIRIQGNMGRLYSEARQKIGDPGDLAHLAAAPAPAAAAAASALPAGTPVVVPGVPAIPRTGDIRDEILQVTSELYQKGMITATGGNVSARCDDNPNEIWITPSAIFKGDLRPDMMVRIDLDGKIIGETDYSASSERRVHCSIYKLRPDITAVIHTHALQATLMAITSTHFLPISTEAAFIGDVPVVPFIMPGTNELGDKVAQAVGATGVAAIMQNHGLVVAGSTLRKAADTSEVIEVTAEKILTCKMLGIAPAVLPEETVKTLLEVGAMLA